MKLEKRIRMSLLIDEMNKNIEIANRLGLKNNSKLKKTRKKQISIKW